MRKTLALALVVFFAAACSDTITTDPQDVVGTANFAVGSSDNPNAAIVIHDGSCFMPGVGEDGSLGGAPGGITEPKDYHKLQNNNKALLSCTGEVTNLSGKGQVFKGIKCGVALPKGGFVTTGDTHYSVSASGQANLKCNVDLSA
jgi:hypothetical protein